MILAAIYATTSKKSKTTIKLWGQHWCWCHDIIAIVLSIVHHNMALHDVPHIDSGIAHWCWCCMVLCIVLQHCNSWWWCCQLCQRIFFAPKAKDEENSWPQSNMVLAKLAPGVWKLPRGAKHSKNNQPMQPWYRHANVGIFMVPRMLQPLLSLQKQKTKKTSITMQGAVVGWSCVVLILLRSNIIGCEEFWWLYFLFGYYPNAHHAFPVMFGTMA